MSPFEKINNLERKKDLLSQEKYDAFLGFLKRTPYKNLQEFFSQEKDIFVGEINKKLIDTEKRFFPEGLKPQNITKTLDLTHQEISQRRREEKDLSEKELLESFSDLYGFDMENVFYEVHIFDEESATSFEAHHFQKPEDFSSRDKIKKIIEKKALVDLYMQGVALNHFGSYYMDLFKKK